LSPGVCLLVFTLSVENIPFKKNILWFGEQKKKEDTKNGCTFRWLI